MPGVCKVVAHFLKRRPLTPTQRFLIVVSGSFLETQLIFHGWLSRGGLNAAFVNYSQHRRPVPQVRGQVEEPIRYESSPSGQHSY